MQPQKALNVFLRPIVPTLLSYMGGLAAGLYLPPIPGLWWILCGICLVSLITAKGERSSHVICLVLFFFLGSWNLQGRTAWKPPVNHVAHFIDGQYWHILGTVDEAPQHTTDRTRFIVNAESLTRGGKSYSVTGGIRITVREPVKNLKKGDRIACLTKLKELSNFNNPGGFDYVGHMAFRGVWASAFVSKKALLIRLHTLDRNRFLSIVDRIREGISALFERLPPRDASAVLKALVIGDRSAIPPHTRDTLSRIGSAHLLAISGLHVGMIAGLAFLFFRRLLSCSETILLAAWCTRGAALLTIVPVVLYGLLAGMSPSTQRAVIMTMVFLLAQLLDREQDSINTLAIAALVILILEPTALFNVSFQLSFAAVFSILFVMRNLPKAPAPRTPASKFIKKSALFLLVSTTAVLGTLPVALFYFNQVSLIGPFTNCVMIPIVGFLVLPLGLLAVLFLPISETIALFVMKGAALALEGALQLAELFARIPCAAMVVVTPSLLEMALYYTFFGMLFRFRATNWAKIGLCVVVLAVLVDVAYWVQKRLFSGNLAVTALDVGQGQAVLIELPGGQCMLVDGGGFHHSSFDMGQRVVAPFLWRKKIATVQTLVLSHPHPDHLNGLLFIARHFHVRELWTNGDPVESPQYLELLRIASEKNIRILGLEALKKPQTVDNVVFEVLYPPPDFVKRKKRERWRTTNNNSLVIKVTLKGVSFLLPGDIEAEGEQELVGLAGNRLKSDILVVPHHGSKTSSTPRFLACVDPSIAVISSGKKKAGLPHETVLRHYKARSCRVFRTDRHGAITIITDGTRLEARSYLADPHIGGTPRPSNKALPHHRKTARPGKPVFALMEGKQIIP